MKSKDTILGIMALMDSWVMIARPCLYDETVVAEANGVIEDPGQGWTSKVAQSEGGSEQTGHKALNLKKVMSQRVKEDFRDTVAQLFPMVSPQDCLSSPFQVQPKKMVS